MTSGLMVFASTVSACTDTAELAEKSPMGTLPDDTTAVEIQMNSLNFITGEASDRAPQSFHSNAINIRRGYNSELESSITGLSTPACQFYYRLENNSCSFSNSVCSDPLDLVSSYDNGSNRQNKYRIRRIGG